jgi:hypothetical protein
MANVSETKLCWAKLLSETRMPAEEDREAPADPIWLVQSRTEAERDFDRILFATPTRRLGDKTQVFPLDKNESVRTRLTHSHEVSNLARSIGTHIVHSELYRRIVADAVVDGKFAGEARLKRSLPATLAAVGLAHDLGNPPFGHQGEEAIRTWIRRNEQEIFTPASSKEPYENGAEMVPADLRRLTPAQKQDFRGRHRATDLVLRRRTVPQSSLAAPSFLASRPGGIQQNSLRAVRAVSQLGFCKSAMSPQPAGRAAKARPWASGPEIVASASATRQAQASSRFDRGSK